ncbi:DUF4268 domain-containing protein [Marinilabilia salmonicolor]|uniref:DUF4268 domain-containing protein n=1 Tax=Marinilabilia salmonicolor TaxID=989 RepID=UPI00029AAAD1|nr:DUF4268 domain-containing protein [Marinilabilia salmonicolor]
MFSKEEAKELRLEFWQKLSNRTRRLPGQKGRKRLWIGDNTGIKGLDLRFDVGREKIIVALEINKKKEEDRLALYEKLEAAKGLFEREFEGPLNWDFAYTKDNGRDVCRVYVEQPGDMYVRETWPEIFTFMIDRMIRLEKAFLEVKDYLKYM